MLEAARAAGLLLRAHAGQFADLGGAALVAELGGISVDHVEQIAPEAMRALATHSVVAVMLPGACVQLRLAPPPVAALRAAGVEMAVATERGSMVIFNGDKVYHGVSPSREGERRVVFTMEYVTSREMGRAQRLFSNLKDAFAYFGIKSLFQSRGRRAR